MSNFLSSLSPFNLLLNIAGLISRNKPVALYDKDGIELLTSASIVSCSVNDTSKVMEHPIESGAVVADYKVFNPVTATLNVSLSQTEFSGEFAEVYSAYKNCEFLTLQTKTNVYSNLQVLSLQHDANVQNINRPQLVIQLKEAIVVEAEFNAVSSLKSASSTSTKNIGNVQTKQVKNNTVLKDLFG